MTDISEKSSKIEEEIDLAYMDLFELTRNYSNLKDNVNNLIGTVRLLQAEMKFCYDNLYHLKNNIINISDISIAKSKLEIVTDKLAEYMKEF